MLSLNYKTYGQGNPIIILHGLFGTLDNWQTIARQLSEEYLVYLVDQRNHGRSPHTDEFDYSLLAEDLRFFMENEGMSQATIVGHSMGGKTAMQFAINYPEMVTSLVVVDIAPKAYEGGHQVIFDALLGIDLTTIESRKMADEQLQAKIPDFGVRQFLLKNLTRDKEGGYHWKMNLPAIYKNYQNILDNILTDEPYTEASLFIRGARSGYIKEADASLIKSIFSEAEIVTIPEAGHWVHAEAPKALLSTLKNFMTKG
jgi:pimeloyl-ACP methyl ester carboxylesterase